MGGRCRRGSGGEAGRRGGRGGRREKRGAALGTGSGSFWLHVRKMFSELYTVRHQTTQGSWVRQCHHGDNRV